MAEYGTSFFADIGSECLKVCDENQEVQRRNVYRYDICELV